MMQNCLAEAGVKRGGPQNQAYIPFPSHGSVYGSLASTAGQLPTGDLWG